MTVPAQATFRNRLLALASAQDFALIAHDLEFVKLVRGTVLAASDQVIEHVYFPEAGIISVVAISPDGLRVEAGLFGRDGCGPTPVVMGSDRSPNETMVQGEGEGYRLPSAALIQAMESGPSLRGLVWRFIHVFALQTAYTALSNAVHPIDERLARWLLMVHDRTDANELHLTHEFIAVMLAVRRPSVTTALHVLEGNRFIHAERGFITIRNRKALEDFAADVYGVPEAEYRRLIEPIH